MVARRSVFVEHQFEIVKCSIPFEYFPLRANEEHSLTVMTRLSTVGDSESAFMP